MNRWAKGKMIRTPEGLVPEIGIKYRKGEEVFVRRYGLDQFIIWDGSPFTKHLIYSSGEASKFVMTYKKRGRIKKAGETENTELNRNHLQMLKRI